MKEYFDQLSEDWESFAQFLSLTSEVSVWWVIGQVTMALFIVITTLLLLTPFFQKALINDPQQPSKFALFTETQPGRTKVKERNGRFIGFIRYGFPPLTWWLLNPLRLYWYFFEMYAWMFGLRVIGIPYLQTLRTYVLQRFVTEESVEETDRGAREREIFRVKIDRSDHVRTLPFTFPFMVSGAEIQTVPFTVKGSSQVRITPRIEFSAFYHTDAWNVFLNQALTGVLRGVVRSDMTIDKVIGAVQKDLWGSEPQDGNAYNEVASRVHERLLQYKLKINGEEFTLQQAASIEVLSVDITDFVPELDKEEMAKIRASIMGRQTGRQRELEGQGEAAFQKSMLAEASTKGEHGHTSLLSEAIVRAAKAGQLDALAAAFLTKTVTGDRK